MNWAAADLSKEWERFYQHCKFTFGGPLSKCAEKEKICNLMSFVGDKGQWETVQVGSGESAQNVNEKDMLQGVVGKFKAHHGAKKNPIMAAVKFDRRRQLQGETFESFVTDLELLARGLDMKESNKLIRNATACKSLDERVGQRYSEKSKNLTLEMAIGIGRMFEATKDGMQVMSGEDPKVEVNKLAWKNGSSKKNVSSKKNMTKFKNVIGVDTMPTSHKKNAQPEMNHATSAEKLDILPKCAEARKAMSTYCMKWSILEKTYLVMRRVLTMMYNYFM